MGIFSLILSGALLVYLGFLVILTASFLSICFFSWRDTCLYGVAFWEIPPIEYPANYLGNGIFLSKAHLCNHESFVFLKPLDVQTDTSRSISTWLDLMQLL